ncbi:MAG: hypothetical protein LBU89_05650 [Fibromonadaceae bacterium]|nr:hypothetical protein [Fibromonadaceae bacterium]
MRASASFVRCEMSWRSISEDRPKERTLVSFDWAIKNLLRNKADYVILEGF